MLKKQTSKKQKQRVIVYQNAQGAIELKNDTDSETIWASLDQISKLFGRDKSVISRHIKNIFGEKELAQKAVVAKYATTALDGKVYQVDHYNLDMIISVGYRVNSKTATNFRIWATKTLKQHITEGYTINRKAILKNHDSFMEAVSKVQALLPADNRIEGTTVLELVRLFADTWFSLDAYDKEALSPKKVSVKKVKLTAAELADSLEILKQELKNKKEATDNFAHERNTGSLEGIVGNVMQSFGGKAVYPTIQSKAAHLLYFIIKNHPFVDGNKRSGAYAFIWFLQKAKVLDTTKLTPTALTVLTILIAESNPNDKDKMIALVTMLIS